MTDYSTAIQEITSAIEVQDFEKARRLLFKARKSWPFKYRVLSLQAQLSACEGAFEDASCWCDEIINRFPHRSKAYFDKASLLLNNSQYEKASQIVQEALDKWPDHFGLKFIRARLSGCLGNFDASVHQYYDLLKTEPGKARVRIALSKLLFEKGRSEEALDVIYDGIKIYPNKRYFRLLFQLYRKNQLTPEQDDRWNFLIKSAFSYKPGSKRIINILSEVMVNVFGLPHTLNYIETLAKDNPDGSIYFCNLAASLRQNVRFEDALTVLDIGEKYFPDDSQLYLQRLKVTRIVQKDQAADLEKARQMLSASADGQTGMRKKKVVQTLLKHGRFDELTDFLHKLKEKESGEEDQSSLLNLLKQLPPPVDEKERNVSPALSRDRLISYRDKNSDKAVLVFTGLGFSAMMPLSVLHAFLAPRAGSIFYLLDPKRMIYTNGIGFLGRNHEQTIASISEMLNAWSISRVYCIGFSAGGFGAILYGADLEAEKVLAFSPFTNLTAQFNETEKRAQTLQQRMLRLKPEMAVDLAEHLQKYDRIPAMTIYYSDKMEQDKKQALNMSALPSVDLRPLYGNAGHGTFRHILMNGGFESVLDDFLSEDAYGPVPNDHVGSFIDGQ